VFVIFCLLKCNWICLKIVQTDRQTDRRRTNGRTDRRTDRRKDDGRTDRQTDGGTDRQTDGQTSVTQSGDINKPLSQRWCKTKVLRASFFFVLLAWIGLLIARFEVIRAVLLNGRRSVIISGELSSLSLLLQMGCGCALYC